MGDAVHLIKLSVGSESVDGLREWQAGRRKELKRDHSLHITRMWPRREAELLQGGSIFWVIQGFVQCRQRILRLDEVTGRDGIRRCAIVLEPTLIRTATARRRPFQGWRYLPVDDAPPDLPPGREDDDALPPALAGALADIGVL